MKHIEMDHSGDKLGSNERPGGDVSQASTTRPNRSTRSKDDALAAPQPTEVGNPLILPPGIGIQEALYAVGRTQTDLAAAMGISQKHLSQIVTGKTGFTADIALKIELALGIPAEDLMQAQAAWNLARARRRASA